MCLRRAYLLSIVYTLLHSVQCVWPPSESQYAAHFTFDEQSIYCGGYNAEHNNWTCTPTPTDNSWGTVKISGVTGEFIDNSGQTGIGAIYTTNTPSFDFSNPSKQIASNNGTQFYHWTIVMCHSGGAGTVYDISPDPTLKHEVVCTKSPIKGNNEFDYLPGICDSNGKIGSQFPFRSTLDDSNIIYTETGVSGKTYVGPDQEYQTLLVWGELPDLPNPVRSIASIIPRPGNKERTTLNFDASTYQEDSWPHPGPDDPPSMNTSYTGSFISTGLDIGSDANLVSMTTLPSGCSEAVEAPHNGHFLAMRELSKASTGRGSGFKDRVHHKNGIHRPAAAAASANGRGHSLSTSAHRKIVVT